MPRKVKSAKPLIYVFCEGESEQAYTDYLKKTFSDVAVLKRPPDTGLFEEAEAKFSKSPKYKNSIDVTDEIWFFYDVEEKDISNSKKTVKALLPDGLPGIDDTDVRSQWLNTKSVTFSNVYEAIEFLQNCG